MWRRAAFCVAGWAGITVCAVLAEETTHIANPNTPQDAFVAYLDDDPPTTQMRAGCVLRLLETLGVRRPSEPGQIPAAPSGTDASIPAALGAAESAPDRLAAVAQHEQAPPPGGDARTLPWVATSAHFFRTQKDWTSSGLVNDLRCPERTPNVLFEEESQRDDGEPVSSALESSGESIAGQPMPVASPTRPVTPILCPDGMTSSRRTIQQAAGGINAAQASAAVPMAAAKASAATESPANSAPSSPSAKSIASLPPLPSLRSNSVSSQLPGNVYHTASWGTASSQPTPAPAPSIRNSNSDASIDSAAETDDTKLLLANSEDPFIEPRSTDAVLEPQAVPVIKATPAARYRADAEPTKIPANAEFAQRAKISLQRRSSLPTSPELPPQHVAASRRQPTSVLGGTTRWASLPLLPNTLRDLPPTRRAELPRPIALQSPPQALTPLPPHSPPLSLSQSAAPLPPHSPPLSLSPSAAPSVSQSRAQLPTPPATKSPPSAPSLPLLYPRRNEALGAAAEPAMLRVAVRESRLMRTSENVVRVLSEHDSVCDVLLFNPREIAVIGKQQGTARVEFWYDGQGLNRVSYLVSVDDGQNPETRPEADHRKVEKLIEYLFPKSCVKLVRDQDRLIVRGTAVNRREAVEIMSTVRRSQLIPVADEIVVQPAKK